MIYLGIDPGLSGAIAWYDADAREASAAKMPATEKDIHDYLRTVMDHWQSSEHRGPYRSSCLAVIEKLGGMPRRSERCKACRGTGFLCVSCQACGHTIRPRCPVCGTSGTISKAQQSPTTMAKLFTNYGHLQMALVGLKIPQHEEVLPRTWQAEFGLLRRPGESITAKKNRHKAVAQKLYPSLKIIHATADALLLAEWLRRKHL